MSEPEHPPENSPPGPQTAIPEGIVMMIPGMEVAAFSLLGKPAIDLVGKGAQAGFAFLNKEGPLLNTISASWFADGIYQIAIKIGNLTAHAIYIENIRIDVPPNIDFDVCNVDDGYLGKAVRAVDYFPIIVKSQEITELVIKLANDVKEILHNYKLVEIKYNYTLAGGAGGGTPLEKNVQVVKAGLRKKGPAYGRRRPGMVG
jgi:hypothetical protein